MVDNSKIYRGYRQKEKSCVLASYAIVSNYFTGLPIIGFFEDYCRHYQIGFTNGDEAEEKYGEHFQHELFSRDLQGYQLTLELHNNSRQKSFKVSRKYFHAEFISNSTPNKDYIIKKLKTKKALLNITFPIGSRTCHSITMGWDYSKGIFYYDTVNGDLSFGNPFDLFGQPRDSMLYTRLFIMPLVSSLLSPIQTKKASS